MSVFLQIYFFVTQWGFWIPWGFVGISILDSTFVVPVFFTFWFCHFSISPRLLFRCFYILVSAFQYFPIFGVPVLVYFACGISVLNFIFVFFLHVSFSRPSRALSNRRVQCYNTMHLYNKTENSWNFRRPYQLYNAKIRS